MHKLLQEAQNSPLSLEWFFLGGALGCVQREKCLEFVVWFLWRALPVHTLSGKCGKGVGDGDGTGGHNLSPFVAFFLGPWWICQDQRVLK